MTRWQYHVLTRCPLVTCLMVDLSCHISTGFTREPVSERSRHRSHWESLYSLLPSYLLGGSLRTPFEHTYFFFTHTHLLLMQIYHLFLHKRARPRLFLCLTHLHVCMLKDLFDLLCQRMNVHLKDHYGQCVLCQKSRKVKFSPQCLQSWTINKHFRLIWDWASTVFVYGMYAN